MVRENVLREPANRAAKDPEFLERARRDLEGTLARYGYHLTDEEMRPVRNLRRQSAGELAGTLATGLAGRGGDPPPCPPDGTLDIMVGVTNTKGVMPCNEPG